MPGAPEAVAPAAPTRRALRRWPALGELTRGLGTGRWLRHAAVPRPPGVSECSRPDEAVGPHVVVSLVPQTTREPSLARGPAIPTSSPGAGPS